VVKSFLSNSGLSDDELRIHYGHKLERLWTEAARRGLGISDQPADWCMLLNSVHTSPYPLRYPSPYNGFVLPARAKVAAELKSLIAKVEAVITT
jgi:hypothetical protein